MDRREIFRNRHTQDWTNIAEIRSKNQGGHDAAWLAYQEANIRQYPEEILNHKLHQVYRRLAFMRNDKQDPVSYSESYLQHRNPIRVEGLVQ